MPPDDGGRPRHHPGPAATSQHHQHRTHPGSDASSERTGHPALLIPDDVAHPDLDPDVLATVHRLVGPALLDLDPAPPEWGTAAWLALASDDPRRDAATTRAAWSWWCAVVIGSGVPHRVVQREVRRALRETSWDVASATDWRVVASAYVSHDELVRRRAQVRGAS